MTAVSPQKKASGDNTVTGNCPKAKCSCMKDAYMCGREVGGYMHITLREDIYSF